MSVSWNPWHGCRKISEGCRNCYVYRQDSRHDKDSREVRQTAMFDRPVRRSRDGRFKVPAVEEVSAGGESGNEARPCDYAWVLGLREQCVAADISFCFHQTGARFVKDGRMYRIHRRYQHSQARKAGIDYRLKR